MLKKHRVTSGAMLLALLILPSAKALGQSAPPPCAITNYGTQTSPNDEWTAQVIEEYCEGDYSFTANGLFQIQLHNLAKQSETAIVFVTNDSGPPSMPQISWTAATTLQINQPGTPYGGIQKTGYYDVKLNYQFNFVAGQARRNH